MVSVEISPLVWQRDGARELRRRGEKHQLRFFQESSVLLGRSKKVAGSTPSRFLCSLSGASTEPFR